MFWIIAGVAVFGLIGYGLQIWAVRSTLKTCKGTEEHEKPAISILKPLKGLDDNLFDNLESFCLLDYPEYEIIFSLQDHNDLAYKVVKKIKDKYPDKDISVLVERCNDGLNPKVNNLIPAYAASKYELVLISDSNVMVGQDYLKEIARHMGDPDVGLVSNLIKGTGGSSIGSIFENLHLNSFIVGSVCFLDRFLKMPCVIGKSMLMRKSALEAIGGLKAVKDFLAEDYVIGDRINKSGRKVVLSNYAINNVNEYWGLKKFINRHTRWGKLRWNIGGIKYFSELISNPVFISCLPLLMMGPTKATISLALSVSLIKAAGDFYLGRMMQKDSASSFSPGYYLLSPIKDLIIGAIWFVPILSSTVVWRGNRYIIGKDSMLSPCEDTGAWAWTYRLAGAIKERFA